VTEGPLAGTSLPLGSSPVLIGRAPECTLVLPDDYASSRHARLVPEDGRWVLEDLGSTNGTTLGRNGPGTPVTGPVVVGPGSVVRIGRTTLELRR
jgi:pSer/pThr/pTyr-binding forkhead associated (FHA) protein